MRLTVFWLSFLIICLLFASFSIVSKALSYEDDERASGVTFKMKINIDAELDGTWTANKTYSITYEFSMLAFDRTVLGNGNWSLHFCDPRLFGNHYSPTFETSTDSVNVTEGKVGHLAIGYTPTQTDIAELQFYVKVDVLKDGQYVIGPNGVPVWYGIIYPKWAPHQAQEFVEIDVVSQENNSLLHIAIGAIAVAAIVACGLAFTHRKKYNCRKTVVR